MRQQRIVIESWCDICEGETAERVPSTSEIEFTFDGMKYAMDLCDIHKDPAWSAMREYATEVGRAVTRGRPKKTASVVPCSACGQTFYSKQGMAAHFSAMHTVHAAEKLQCPFCDFIVKGPQGMPPHIRSKHPEQAISADGDD